MTEYSCESIDGVCCLICHSTSSVDNNVSHLFGISIDSPDGEIVATTCCLKYHKVIDKIKLDKGMIS